MVLAFVYGIYSFPCGYPVFPAPNVEDYPFPSGRSWHLVSHLSILFLCPLFYSSGLHVCVYANTTLFDYCGFVISFEIRKCESSSFIFQDFLGYLESIETPYEF